MNLAAGVLPLGLLIITVWQIYLVYYPSSLPSPSCRLSHVPRGRG